jgi:signal transduction histidine kinase/ActR/RegA family two-component response regulator
MKRILVSRFGLLSLGCIGAIAVIMGFVLSSLLARAASEWEWENTAALVRREARMAGLERAFASPGGPEERERWGRELSRLLTSLPEIVRIQVWDHQATVLWSGDLALIGRQFRDKNELREALGGKVGVEIQSPTKQEHRSDGTAFTTLAEIYVPIHSDDGRVLGVVEVSKTPTRLLATVHQGRIAVWTVSLAGALLLYLVMHPLLSLVYRREVEEETLRAETGRIEAEVAQRTEQLFQTQKMEAVGLLAGGIAHDFNNLLTVIRGRAQLLLGARSGDDQLTHGLGLIEKTADRAAALIRQLLALGRKQIPQRRVLNLNSVVADMDKVLRPLISEHISMTTELDPAVCPINADPERLGQILLNLVVNARDAMPKGGQLVVKTTSVEVDEATAARKPGLRAGGYAVLTVSDTGVGMDEATRLRVFEPFFTTKEPGQGTGLGLSTVYCIVEQHRGMISVESGRGLGTTFTIHLPHAEAAVEAAEAGPEPAASTSGAETILVVEDDDEVRALTIEILKGRGYTVLAAADGPKALHFAARHPGPIHLLLTDIVMPYLNGWELAQQIKVVRSETKVLYMTGYSEITIVHEGASGLDVLQKPFTPDSLARRVLEALHAVKMQD